MVLKTENGKLLEVKEGVVVNENGEPLFEPSTQSRFYRLGGLNRRLLQIKGWKFLALIIPLGVIIGFATLLMSILSVFFIIFRIFFPKKTTFNFRI